jgi:hypothetical protein
MYRAKTVLRRASQDRIFARPTLSPGNYRFRSGLPEADCDPFSEPQNVEVGCSLPTHLYRRKPGQRYRKIFERDRVSQNETTSQSIASIQQHIVELDVDVWSSHAWSTSPFEHSSLYLLLGAEPNQKL